MSDGAQCLLSSPVASLDAGRAWTHSRSVKPDGAQCLGCADMPTAAVGVA